MDLTSNMAASFFIINRCICHITEFRADVSLMLLCKTALIKSDKEPII